MARSQQTLPEERASDLPDLFEPEAEGVPRISAEQLASQLQSPQPPIVLDVRARAHYAADKSEIPGSIRVPPDLIADWAAKQSKARPVVTYCT